MTWAPVYIGSVPCRIRSSQHQWTSEPTAGGQRAATIAGVMQWPQAQYLSELVANPELAQTHGNATGVLEVISFGADDPLLRMFSGWYLLMSFQITPEHQWSGHGVDYPVAFSLVCSFLGANREAVVISTSHQLANEFGVVGTPWVANPFADEVTDGTGSWLVIDVDGTEVLREYDPTDTVSMGDNTEVLVP